MRSLNLHALMLADEQLCALKSNIKPAINPPSNFQRQHLQSTHKFVEHPSIVREWNWISSRVIRKNSRLALFAFVRAEFLFACLCKFQIHLLLFYCCSLNRLQWILTLFHSFCVSITSIVVLKLFWLEKRQWEQSKLVTMVNKPFLFITGHCTSYFI